MLFTNGTGTGKTYSGLGIIKRFSLKGKTNTLVIVPDDKIASDWIKSGRNLGLSITKLDSTTTAGRGIVITSYANLGANDELARRKWDLVVADEAHSLMQSADGDVTTYLANLRAITHHPSGAQQLHTMRNRESLDKAAALSAEITANEKIRNNDDTMDVMRDSLARENERLAKELSALRKHLDARLEADKAEVQQMQGEKRARAVFLSATPFAYEKTIDWANGYLFDYKEGYPYDEERAGLNYNQPNPREHFFMTHLGYRMRVNKLTEPDGSKVDRGLLQRQFNGWMKKQGSLAGRMLDVPADYDRRFVLVDSAIGNQIDEALQWLSDQARSAPKDDGGFSALRSAIEDKFDYLSRRYLLEAIKATEVVPIVKAHMALGRKVVVFHDYKKGGGFNPFDVKPASTKDSADEQTAQRAAQFNAALAAFRAKFTSLANHPFHEMPSPIEVFKREFDDVLLVNGDEKSADLLKRYDTFQDDASGPKVMLVQSAKNKGWSGHDTTGKHQRVLINLGQPTAPTLAIQQEGRIYRTGQVSNAIMRYLNTGTNWEKYAFASTIAGRASTSENLGMGELSRALKDSFINAFEESDAYPPGHEGEGTGGKERDKANNAVITEWDRSKTMYWATAQKTSKTKAQEGKDYFATPEPVGLKMVQWLDLRGGEDAMEPSGGHGAIARWLPETTTRTVIEPSMALRSRLAMVMNDGDYKIIDGVFEDHNIVNKYDGIVMNPPFGTAGRTAVDHLAKAATHLRDGGRIVALIPTGPAADAKFDKWFYGESERPAKPLQTRTGMQKVYAGDTIIFEGKRFIAKSTGKYPRSLASSDYVTDGVTRAHHGEYSVEPGPRTESFKAADGLHMVANITLPPVTFERAGTSVATRIVVLEKQADGAPDMGSTLVRDLSSIDDINTLFDRMEDLSMPARSKPQAAEPEEKPSSRKPVKAESPQQPSAEVGSTVTLMGKPYKVVIYTTNAGKDIRGAWVPDRQIAQRYSERTFKKSGFGWFVREKDFPKVAQEPAGEYTVDAPRRKYGADPQADLFNDQLDLFLNSQPDASQAGPAVEVSRRDAAEAVHDLRSTPSVLAQALSGDYAARQRANLVGQTVASAEDLAVLAQVYRDPRFETFRVIFTNAKGAIVSQVGLTSRLPGSTAAIVGDDIDQYVKDLSQIALTKGATSYYLLHNHPSGKADASEADRRLTRDFDVPRLVFKGHVVIDTNEYSVINAQGVAEKFQRDMGQSDRPTSTQWGGRIITSPRDVMDMAKQMEADHDAVTLIVADGRHRVLGITTVPHSAITESSAVNQLMLAKTALRAKGATLFAVGRNKTLLARLNGGVMDAIHVSDAGAVGSLAEAGVIYSKSPFPLDRRTRLSPDTSPEFGYLRALTQPYRQGRKVAENDEIISGTSFSQTGQGEGKFATMGKQESRHVSTEDTEKVNQLSALVAKALDTREPAEGSAYRAVSLSELGDLRTVAAAFGKTVVGYHIAPILKGTKSPFSTVGGVSVRAIPNTIFINETNNRPHLSIMGHELAHELRRDAPEIYDDLVQAIRPFINQASYRTEFPNEIVARELASKKNWDGMREEFIGEVLSDGFTEPAFWNALGEKSPTLLSRVVGALGNLIDKVRRAFGQQRQTEKYLTDFDAVMRLAGEAMARYAAAPKIDNPGTTDFETIKDRIVPSYARSDTGDVRIVYPERAAGQARGAPDPDIRFSRNAEDAEDEPTLKPSGSPLDTLLRKFGGTLAARITSPAYAWLARTIDAMTPEMVKAGVVADYGLKEDYLDRKQEMKTAQRQHARKLGNVIDSLQGLDSQQSRVAYFWMQTRPDDAAEARLMAQLPKESQEALTRLKGQIDDLGQEAVKLGLITGETVERNRMAYLHRSYKRYELEDGAGVKAARGAAVKVLGDQFKMRGLRDDAPMAKIAELDWYKRKTQEGKADTSLKGQMFHRLERRATPDLQTEEMFGSHSDKLGKLREVVYWPVSEAIPRHMADWRNDGQWEARFFDKSGKVGMWRDFTTAERTAMGEIQEVRYAVAKTIMQMSRDVETARFLDWVARTQAVLDESQLPEDAIALENASTSMAKAYLKNEWVKIPTAAIPGTGGLKRYGNLAGRWVPGPIWNDLRQISSISDQDVISKIYGPALRAWKISKTALSPATHMNNVMANFVMADAHDIQGKHLLETMRVLRDYKRDPKAQAIIEAFQDSGGDGGMFNAEEIKSEIFEPLLKQLDESLKAEAGPTNGLLMASHIVTLLRAKEFRQAFAAIGKTRTAGAMKIPAKWLMKLYGQEDEFFRLAAFIKAKEDGLTDQAAGKFARDSFLNYEINAPWIQALRRSAMPFIAFTYRAAPMMAKIAADKPWKIAKYMLVAGALSKLGYLMSGGDEDEERAFMPEEKDGNLWGVVPKLIRMPWNDSYGQPVFLDIRRWIPVGDVVDFGQSHSAIPLPPSVMPGGPVVILGEVVGNTSLFTGNDITLATDTLAEKYSKVADHLWKAVMPNIPIPTPLIGLPGTYSADSLINAGKGKTDNFGREQSLGQAAASSIGIKLGSYPTDVLRANAGAKLAGQISEVRRGLRSDARQFGRQGIDQDQFNERAARAQKKISDLTGEYERKGMSLSNMQK